MRQFPVLHAEQLDGLDVPVVDAMAAIESALAALGRKAAQQPRPGALVPEDGGFFQPITAALPDDDIACVNWLTYHPGNPARGLAHSGGVLILNRFASGEPLCIMDGIWISHRRTGYIAGLGVKHLAADFDDVAIIGPGAIAAFALDAIRALGPIRGELRVCARHLQSAERFCAHASSRLGTRCAPHTDPRAAVEGARLVLTATTHSGPPFLEPEWLAGGTLVVMIDRLRVVTRELLARAGRIVTNSRESLASWGFDEQARGCETLPEIIAAGRREPVGPDEIVLYDAGGLAVADLAFAALVWRRLQETNASAGDVASTSPHMRDA
jgi:ornithine cyclodeaminase/alanine dehydrogenase-like protein (mu-crystallin family)